MLNKINLQYTFSYLGIFPFLCILIDKYFFFQIKEEIIINFLIYYTLMISVFIGSMNWNLETRVKNHLIIYGTLPSLFSLIIIILNLYKLNQLLLINLISIFLLLQLVLDYLFVFYSKKNKNFFYLLRVPLTFMIIINLIIIKL